MIDEVLQELNGYDAARVRDPQRLVGILKRLFNRPAFYASVLIEEPRYFLFALCWARMLLDRYLQDLAATYDPARLQAIVQAIHGIAEETARYIGGGFNLSDHTARYIQSKEKFIKNLRTPKLAFSKSALELRNALVSELRSKLHEAGLLGSP